MNDMQEFIDLRDALRGAANTLDEIILLGEKESCSDDEIYNLLGKFAVDMIKAQAISAKM